MTTCDSRVAFALLLVGILAVSPSARAQDASKRDPQRAFKEGRTLMNAGRFAEAATKFEESLAIKETAGASLNLGDCYEKLGRYASAIAAFERARAISAHGGDQERAEEAKWRVVQLRPTVSTIKVRLEPAVSGATVSIDEKATTLGNEAAVDGGEHAVVVTAPCYKSFESHVTVGPRSDTKEVTAALERRQDAECAKQETAHAAHAPLNTNVEPPPSASSSSSWTGRKTLAVAVGAVGMVGLGFGTAFGLAASGKQDDLKGACTSYPHGCPVSRRSELDGLASDADRAATISTVAFVAGVALVVGAAAIWLTSPRATKTQGSSFIQPQISF